ncbi:hypothetical protein OKA05_23485 [Luteolibacter arcticus]|uniref:Uncharacterized protein n=1 Tax=Luteolibacter arcticus TaxID=1581411 RepID=A0ABT3GPZ1_9BACT|nr:hypothetical protein [Luteolibacter arcticus]MCW1925541.1 hypothetical protein [Luteolibacter arcticus]
MKKSTCSLLAGLLTLSCLHAQGNPATPPAADPFKRNPAEEAAAREAFMPRVVSICVETFSLELADAAALYHQKLPDSKVYAEITARVAKGQARQESFSVIRARSGERAMVENISEYIYPTEFDHGNAANTTPAPPVPNDGTKPALPTPPAAPATPTATAPVLPTSFETRNVGFTLEIEPTIGENDDVIDVRIVPDRVTLAERVKWGQGVSEAEMPVFETQRMTLATTLLSGQPQLLGTPSRPPVSKVDADSANRVWFSFVTGDIVKVVKEK